MNAPSRAADLIHKVWFITGASSGLGLELARAALKRGDFVAATSRAVTSVLGGDVVNVAAIAGYSAFPGWGIYSATKFAVEGLTEAMAIELAPLGIHDTVVEPGFFRTNFLDPRSLVTTALSLPDYAKTVGEMRAAIASANHRQPGDPKKLSKALLKLVDSDKPPLRLPLGTDTVARIAEKHRLVEAELERWLDVAKSTDHDDVAK